MASLNYNFSNNKFCHSSVLHYRATENYYNKPKGLKVAKEDQRSIGSIVDRLDG